MNPACTSPGWKELTALSDSQASKSFFEEEFRSQNSEFSNLLVGDSDPPQEEFATQARRFSGGLKPQS